MQNLLVDQLKEKIGVLPFIDLSCGLAQTLTTSLDGVVSKSPITTDAPGLSVGNYQSLVPDSNRRGMTYFEHRSLVSTGVEQRSVRMLSVLRLVCFMDISKIAVPFADAYAQAAIIARIPDVVHTSGTLARVQYRIGKILLLQDNIFDKYTYTETHLQYLMYPYTAFAIEIETSFHLPLNCLPSALLPA